MATRSFSDRYRGWLPLLVLPPSGLALSMDQPSWARMWCLAFAIFCGCKWLTWRRTPTGASRYRQLGYLFGWPGLDAETFLNRSDSSKHLQVTWSEWSLAVAKTLLGLLVVYCLAPRVPKSSSYLLGWVGMIGIVLTLHFGLFHLMSCTWRAVGVAAQPLMNAPLAATSVSEFWGRRWNTAFRDLTHRYLFRPLTSRLGSRWALAFGFLFSGLVHDLVISVPPAGGYGGPTLYFMIQACGMFIERSAWGRRVGLGSGWRGWLFCALCLVPPVPLLFHRPFAERIIVPFLHALRAV